MNTILSAPRLRWVNRIILPTLNKCVTCRKSEESTRLIRLALPGWFGWHSARRGLRGIGRLSFL